MEFYYLFQLIQQFFKDPFNHRALDIARRRISWLEAENADLRSDQIIPPGPDTEGTKPVILQPFRIKTSMRSRKAKKEAEFNTVQRRIQLNAAIARGDKDVHIKDDRQELRQSANRESDGRERV
jgi:hypothetical protein